MKQIKNIAFEVVADTERNAEHPMHLRSIVEFVDGGLWQHSIHIYNHVQQADGSWKYEPAPVEQKQDEFLVALPKLYADLFEQVPA